MKSVYIDVLITVNVFIDFILILCTKKGALYQHLVLKKIVACVASGGSSKVLLHFSLPCLSF